MCYVLNCKIDSLTSEQVFQQISESLKSGSRCRIVTVNPEYILEARKDKQFQDIINNADLAVADGTGILWTAKFQSLGVSSNIIIRTIQCIAQYVWTGASLVFWPAYRKTVIPERISGAEISQSVISYQLSVTHVMSYGLCVPKIFLLGGYDNIAEKIKERFAHANIVGSYEGIPESESDTVKACEAINDAKPNILLVAYGNPASRQEKWIEKNLPKFPSVKIAMGVGGSFNFLAGNVARAPKWIQKIGIEWLWRLGREPWRVGRIFRAVVMFSLIVLVDKITKPYCHPESFLNKKI